MTKHRNPYIDDEAKEEKEEKKSTSKTLTSLSMVDLDDDLLYDSDDNDYHSRAFKKQKYGMHLLGLSKSHLITPEKKQVIRRLSFEEEESYVQMKRGNEILTQMSNESNDEEIEDDEENTQALMSQPTALVPISVPNAASRLIVSQTINKKNIDLAIQKIDGDLTIVHNYYHNSIQGGFVMQGVVAINRKDDKVLTKLDIRFSACLSVHPNTNIEKRNWENWPEIVFVVVNPFCGILQEEGGQARLLAILANWFNKHSYTNQKGLVSQHGFSTYSLLGNYDQTKCPLRKLGDIVILSDAIRIVEELYVESIRSTNRFRTKVIPIISINHIQKNSRPVSI
jgi:hypothetical protein